MRSNLRIDADAHTAALARCMSAGHAQHSRMMARPLSGRSGRYC